MYFYFCHVLNFNWRGHIGSEITAERKELGAEMRQFVELRQRYRRRDQLPLVVLRLRRVRVRKVRVEKLRWLRQKIMIRQSRSVASFIAPLA